MSQVNVRLFSISAIVLLAFLLCLPVAAQQSAEWQIALSPDQIADRAVSLAVGDLNAAGRTHGIAFTVVSDKSRLAHDTIVVGDTSRNRLVRRLHEEGKAQAQEVYDSQGFAIQTVTVDGNRVLVVTGGSEVGDVYGLYWIWDRLRVYGSVPDVNVRRAPVLGIRFAGGATRENMNAALRYTANWVTGTNILDLVPWNAEPEGAANARNRKEAQISIDYAHALHMKYFAYCDEITYHPSLWEEFGATTDLGNEGLWDALQAKYRRLLTELPGLDGVVIRTGELTRVHGDYIPYDLMHDSENEDWSLDRRYRTFVQKMHEVIVGEFDKIYYHRTWVPNTTEQHSRPDVFKAIFTDEVPTRKLYLSPYITTADRWLYQPHNPTFNLTPHNMVVLLASLEYHAHGGVNIVPTFPGPYFQDGLRSFLAPEFSNVKGMQFGPPNKERWSTGDLTAYTAFRLAWDPDEDLEVIARDYASIHFGPAAAPYMAEIVMLSSRAYMDGLYVKPVAESVSGNTLPHLRLTTFRVHGFPAIDQGKEQMEWLEATLYRPCKDRIAEAIEHLDRGLATANRIREVYQEADPHIANREAARRAAESVDLMYALIETNNFYIKTCFAYFQYRDDDVPENRERLAQLASSLRESSERLHDAPGSTYKTFGIDQALTNAAALLDNRAHAIEALANAPDADRVGRFLAEHQARHANAVTQYAGEATKFLHWRGHVDGKDALRIRGDAIVIEHILGDHINHIEHEFLAPLPEQAVTVLLDDRGSRAPHPFVLEQPSPENDYTVTLYLYDQGDGYAWFEFDLYYVPKSPAALGLAPPWNRETAG